MAILLALVTAAAGPTAWLRVGVTSSALIPGLLLETLVLYGYARPRGHGVPRLLAIGGPSNLASGFVLGMLLWIVPPITRLMWGRLTWMGSVPILLIVISAIASTIIRRAAGSVAVARPLGPARTFAVALVMNTLTLAVYVGMEAARDPVFLHTLF